VKLKLKTEKTYWKQFCLNLEIRGLGADWPVSLEVKIFGRYFWIYLQQSEVEK